MPTYPFDAITTRPTHLLTLLKAPIALPKGTKLTVHDEEAGIGDVTTVLGERKYHGAVVAADYEPSNLHQ